MNAEEHDVSLRDRAGLYDVKWNRLEPFGLCYVLAIGNASFGTFVWPD